MEENKKNGIQIEIDEITAQGSYANLAMISHSDSEFIFDFIFVQPQAPKARVRARVLTSPSHAKRILSALGDNVAKYEARFGEIKAAVMPEEKKVGYYN